MDGAAGFDPQGPMEDASAVAIRMLSIKVSRNYSRKRGRTNSRPPVMATLSPL